VQSKQDHLGSKAEDLRLFPLDRTKWLRRAVKQNSSRRPANADQRGFAKRQKGTPLQRLSALLRLVIDVQGDEIATGSANVVPGELQRPFLQGPFSGTI
jgi:hypothetical protein